MNYTQGILNLIQELELLRVAELKKFGSIALVFAFIAFIFFIKFRSNFLPLLGLGFFIIVGSYYYLNNNYKTKVENTLMPKLIALVDKDFVYNKDGKVDLELINSFKLFSHEIKNENSNSVVSIEKDGKSAKISSIVLESVRMDTEEGEHETKRFDGAFVILDLKKSFDQKYLLSPKDKGVDFEAGDDLNSGHMGLKPTAITVDKLLLFSEDGKSSLDNSIIDELSKTASNIKAVFDKDKIYLFADGVGSSYNISLFSTLKEQNFFDKYALFLRSVKELLITSQ
jgi:hypothetical protein